MRCARIGVKKYVGKIFHSCENDNIFAFRTVLIVYSSFKRCYRFRRVSKVRKAAKRTCIRLSERSDI